MRPANPADADAAGPSPPAGDGPAWRVSVRALAAFVARRGDLMHRVHAAPSARQGREGHALVRQRRPAHHEHEIALEGRFGRLRVLGRADGFDPQAVELEEVKTHRGPLAHQDPGAQAVHRAQACLYGHLLAEARGLPGLTVTLVYLELGSGLETRLPEAWTAAALRAHFEACAAPYLAWAEAEDAHRRRRDAWLRRLRFPEPAFRPGQRELAARVWRACTDPAPRVLRVQAPTGTGKTLGLLYPALRALPEAGGDLLAFLSARTTGRQVALDALARLGGATAGPLRVLELVAKDRACEHPGRACQGQACPLAQGFFDKLPAARRAALDAAWLDRSALRRIALDQGVCPYHLGQALAPWADVLVGDMHHGFDRHGLLPALAQERGLRLTVLVDEAHQLVPRARAMHSAALSREAVRAVLAQAPAPVRPALRGLLDAFDGLLALARQEAPGQPWWTQARPPEGLLRALQRLGMALQALLAEHPEQAPGPLLDLHFEALAFLALAEDFGPHSVCALDLAGAEEARPPGRARRPAARPAEAPGTPAQAGLALAETAEPARLRLDCAIPAPFLQARLARFHSLVLASATLYPAAHDQALLGLPDSTETLVLPNPFDPAHLAVEVRPLATGPRQRAATLPALVGALLDAWDAEPGNHLVFFSSFAYLQAAARALAAARSGLPLACQDPGMDEAARLAFLDGFRPDGRRLGLAVLGGAFGEGVDLPGRRLVGVAVVTLGQPVPTPRLAALQAALDAAGLPGALYAARLPGLMKVVQAAGRLIRGPEDRGRLLLVDRRYADPAVRAALPPAWFSAARR